MSHFIICPVRPAGGMDMDGATVISDKVARLCLKKYWVDEGLANNAAKALAKQNPQVQFAVFKPSRIYETLPPAEPKLIAKRINETGEIVLDNGD